MAKGTSQRRNSGSARQKAAGGSPAKGKARSVGGAGGPAAEHVSAVALNSPRAEASRAGPARIEAAQQPAPASAAAAGAASAAPSRTPKPAAVAANRSNGTGRSGQVLAGAIGGLIVLLLALALQWLVLDPMRAGSAAQDQQLMALSQEISTLEQALAQMEEEIAAAGSGEGLTALEERVGALEGDGASADVEAGLADLVARLESVEAERQALTERVAALEEEIADRSAEESINQAFAAARLKSAIDRGGAFAPALQAFAAVAPDHPAVAALDDFAETGVPTRDQLADRFPDVAQEMLTAVHAGAADDGMIDRLMASARSVVTVRPTGAVEGESVEAIIARMEAAIGEGDLAAAIAEWESLPETAKAASEDYAADLRARAEADTILNDALSAATEAVSQETN
jgi:hypothetical protein